MHRLLERQLRRIFGKDRQSDPGLMSFLDIVDGYCHEVDKEQRLMMNAAEPNAVMVEIFSAERALQAAEQVEMSAGQKGSEQAAAELEIAIAELQSAIREYQW